MSQNDALLIEKGVPVLSKYEKDKLRGKWQSQTWDDMLLSLNSFGKYIMLRPTGFGKTFTCAAACNIGVHTEKEIDKANKLGVTLSNNDILLNNGKVLDNKRISNIHKKKVIFVYISEILKQTFNTYVENGLIINGRERVQYETYASVQLHWGDKEYLKENLDIENVGLVIFDEVQRMGAIETSKALEIAIPYLEELGIYYIGATATHERATGYDVCDKYFKHYYPGTDKYTYCWGEHIYSLNDCFSTGLLLPPHYEFITDNPDKIKKYRKEVRQTRASMIAELNTMDATNPNRDILINNIKELQNAIIKNSSKIVHDTMIELYDCGSEYVTNEEVLGKAEHGSLKRPERLPKYMRFLVFAPNQESLKSEAVAIDENGRIKNFGNMVARTRNDFLEAFGRYGYRIRTTIISSANSKERNNVKLIDNEDLAAEEANEIAAKAGSKMKARVRSEEELGKAVVPQDLVIDLIFSINMLNVGYHVEGITGIVFKRWTGSNQIFLQQLGRCLSSVSDTIPVVFDYVNVEDSRGITAPLYTYDRQNKKVTENADGTVNLETKNKTKKKVQGTFNRIQLDNDGVILPVGVDGRPVNPAAINKIDAKYVIVDTKTASIDKIVSRCNVYQERINSKKIYNIAYDKYMSYIDIQGKHLISNVYNIGMLSEMLRLTILKVDKQAAQSKNLTINFKAFLEYLKNNKKDVYVLYDALDEYIDTKGNCEKFKAVSSEINSLIAVSKTVDNSIGVNIKILISKNKIDEFRNNKKMMELLRDLLFNTSTDLIYY